MGHSCQDLNVRIWLFAGTVRETLGVPRYKLRLGICKLLKRREQALSIDGLFVLGG